MSRDAKSNAGFYFALLVAAALLFCIWALPVAGFHHMYLVGIFGWLAINGEDPDPSSIFYFDGYEFVPTLWGLPINVVATFFITKFLWRMSRKLESP